MIFKNPKLLKSYHGAGRCELCGKFCPECEPHHVQARGMGGGSRLDLEICLLRVGSWPCCECHIRIDSKEGKQRCLAVLARRYNTTPDVIEGVFALLNRLPKGTSRAGILAAGAVIGGEVERILRLSFGE